MSLKGAQLKILLEEQFKGCALDFPPGISAPRFNQVLFRGLYVHMESRWGDLQPSRRQQHQGDGVIVVPMQKYRVTANNFVAEGGARYPSSRAGRSVWTELGRRLERNAFAKLREFSSQLVASLRVLCYEENYAPQSQGPALDLSEMPADFRNKEHLAFLHSVH